MKALLIALLLAVSAPLAAAAGSPTPRPPAGQTGMVTSVVDGDSVWFTPDKGGKAIEVRLAGIDAPEICQDHGAESKQFLVDLVLRKPARLVVGQAGQAHDTYGRTLGTLYVGEVEVNRLLVEEGQAWSIRVKWDQGPLVPQERMARALSRGLHKVGSAALQPKDFRLRHGPCAGAEPSAPPPTAPTAPTAPGRSAAPAAEFRCDGRTRCSQMRSCAEANYFLKNCPGVNMDGNKDGVPCELQWCGKR